MFTYLAIEKTLLSEASQLGGFDNANDAVKQALQEYIQRRKQLKLLDLFGTVEYQDNYNTKEQRNFKA